MIAFPEMLVKPARDAGMMVPEDPDDYDAATFPHWHVYLTAQLGAGMPTPDAHWNNAKVIAAVPTDHIKKVTVAELISQGFSIST